jgi:hypothetical protein
MNGDEDRILESGLQEVLGGQYPPDLTAKILQELERRGVSPTQSPVPFQAPTVVSWPVSPLTPTASPVAAVDPADRRATRQGMSAATGTGDVAASDRFAMGGRRSKSRVTGWSVAVASGVVLALFAAGIYVSRTALGPRGPLLVQSPQTSAFTPVGPEQPDSQLDSLPHRDMPTPWVPDAEFPSPDEAAAIASASEPSSSPIREAFVEERSVPAEVQREPWDEARIIAFVDQMLDQQWRQHGVTPAAPPNDNQWCQRVYQRLVGRDPTPDELRQFRSEPSGRRRTALVDRLLESDDYARYWSERWAEVLLGSAAEQPERWGIDRQGLQEYLAAAMQENKPYDQLSAELLAASGSCDPAAADHDAAANFLVAAWGREGSIAATDRVARVWLGKQLVCARCHDDPSSGWSQDEFWQLNAFFQQIKVQRGPENQFAVVKDIDFHGGTGIPQDAEIFYRGQDGRLQAAYPEFGSQRIPKSGLLADVHRRQELARLVTRSVDFRRTAVNRVWAELLRYGFIEPVDSAGPDYRPSHPELLDGLSEQLAAHDFDLKRLTRWIVLSRAFDVSDQRTAESWMDTPETGGTPLFARFYIEPDRSMDLHRSLMLAVRTRPSGSTLQASTLARRSWTPSSVSIPQIIDTQGSESMIGPPWLDRLAASPMSADQKVEHLFRAALDRKPTGREATAAKLVLADRMNDHLAVRELWQILFSERRRL